MTELQRGQRVRVVQGPIEGVVTNPNGPVISVEREDGGNFLFEPLSSAKIELVDEESEAPTLAVLALLPTSEVEKRGIEFASEWVINAARGALQAADPDDEKSLVHLTYTPIKNKAAWMERTEILWAAYVKNCAARGIDIPDA